MTKASTAVATRPKMLHHEAHMLAGMCESGYRLTAEDRWYLTKARVYIDAVLNGDRRPLMEIAADAHEAGAKVA